MKTCPEALCKGFGLHDWFLLHMNSSIVAGIEPNGQGRLKAPFSFLNRRFSSHCLVLHRASVEIIVLGV